MLAALANKFGTNRSEPVETDIIAALTAEHRVLLELHKAISDAVAARKYAAIPKFATQLHDQLHNHLTVEHLKLYTTLRRKLEKDNEKLREIYNLQREMYSIGHGAVDFIRRASEIKLSDVNAERFSTDLNGVGSVLVQRIRKEEEELYPLYNSL